MNSIITNAPRAFSPLVARTNRLQNPMLCCKLASRSLKSTSRLGSMLPGALMRCGVVCAQSNRVQLTFQSSWTGIVFAAALQVSSNYAYLADGVTDLQIVDVGNPTDSIAAGSFVRNGSERWTQFPPPLPPPRGDGS